MNHEINQKLNQEEQKKINLEFITAVLRRDLIEVKKLLANGAQHQTSQYYALGAAAQTNNKEMLEYLIESGNYNPKTGLEGALSIALTNLSDNDTLAAARYLKSKGASLSPIQAKYAITGAIEKSTDSTMAFLPETIDYVVSMCGEKLFDGNEVAWAAAKKQTSDTAQYLIENYAHMGLDLDYMHQKGSPSVKHFIEVYREKKKLELGIEAGQESINSPGSFKV